MATTETTIGGQTAQIVFSDDTTEIVFPSTYVPGQSPVDPKPLSLTVKAGLTQDQAVAIGLATLVALGLAQSS